MIRFPSAAAAWIGPESLLITRSARRSSSIVTRAVAGHQQFRLFCVGGDPGQFREGRGVAAAEQGIDQSDIALDRVPGDDRQPQSVAEPGGRFPGRGKSDHRSVVSGEPGEECTAGQSLKIDDEVVASFPERPDQFHELRKHGFQPPHPFPFKENPAGDRPRTVVENLRECRMYQKIQLGGRETAAQQFQGRKHMKNIPETARLDH